MARIDFGIGIGIAGIVLGIIIVVLDKAGKLKGPWLLILLAVAGVMTLFIAVGNVWVLESPEKWKLWRGGLMIALVAFSYTGIGIWISSDSEPKEVTEKVAGAIAEKQPDSSKYGNLAQRTEDLSRDLRVYTEARKGGLHELLKRANAPDPQWSPQKRPCAVRAKPAMHGSRPGQIVSTLPPVEEASLFLCASFADRI